MDTGQLVPDDAQILGALGHLHAHEGLDGLGVAEGVPHGADAADALGNVDELVVVAGLHELLQAAVHEPDLREHVHDGLVLHHQIEVQRLREHRVLGPEGNDGRLAHAILPSLLRPFGPWLP